LILEQNSVLNQMSADESDTESVAGIFEETRALEVTTSGSIIATCLIDGLSVGGVVSPEVNIGQWRFKLKVRKVVYTGNTDEFVQFCLYNCLHMEVRATMSIQLVNAANECLKELVPGTLTVFGCEPGRRYGLKLIMPWSRITNSSKNIVENGRFYVRVNLVIVHTDTASLCSYTRDQWRCNALQNTIAADFADVYDNQAVPSDFCIVATTTTSSDSSVSGVQLQEMRIPVHKLILAARSPVFRAMLSSGMHEASADEMEITGYAVEAVRAFVRFLYCDVCMRADLNEHAWDLQALADKYDVPSLGRICESYLITELCEENALHTLVRAHAQGASMLKQKAIGYIVTTGKQLLKKPSAHELLGSELLLEVVSGLVDTVDRGTKK
jgi:hypothetical protein